jgi:hypothetical protein
VRIQPAAKSIWLVTAAEAKPANGFALRAGVKNRCKCHRNFQLVNAIALANDRLQTKSLTCERRRIILLVTVDQTINQTKGTMTLQEKLLVALLTSAILSPDPTETEVFCQSASRVAATIPAERIEVCKTAAAAQSKALAEWFIAHHAALN